MNMAKKSLVKPRRRINVITDQGKVVGAISHDEVRNFETPEPQSAIEDLNEKYAQMDYKLLVLEASYARLKKDFGEVVRLLLESNREKALAKITVLLRRYSNLNT